MLDVELDSAQQRALLEFRELLLRWNRAFNLVSRKDVHRLLPRHLLDSLSVAPWLSGARVLDLGTGAGLPGVPLAIVRRDVAFTLVDRSARRIRFVRHAARALCLDNVSPWCGDVGALSPGDTFDTVVSRAVAGIEEVWRLIGGRLSDGGRLLVMHQGQGRGGAPVPGCLPGGCVSKRAWLTIPGLEQPHELVVIERRPAGENGDRP